MKLFSKPTLGGWLTIANGTAWRIGIFVLQCWGNPNAYALFLPISFLLSLPFAFFWTFVQSSDGRTEAETIKMAIVIGLNAFPWGYGLAWFIQKARK